MQSNTGNTNTGNSSNLPFVKLFEKGVTQFVILEKAKQGEVTKENIRSIFKGNLQMGEDHVETCLKELVQNGHLKENGNKYTITDDGREDIQKVESFIPELQQYVGNKGQGQGQGTQQKTSMTQQTTTGGSSSTGGNTGNAGGQNANTQNRTSGTQGNQNQNR